MKAKVAAASTKEVMMLKVTKEAVAVDVATAIVVEKATRMDEMEKVAARCRRVNERARFIGLHKLPREALK